MSDRLEITPKETDAWLRSGTPATLVDVREPEEFQTACIAGSETVPLRSLPAELQRLRSLAEASDLLVICHHGVRSLQAVHWLRSQGIRNCYSVAGGIEHWSREIDPTVPRY